MLLAALRIHSGAAFLPVIFLRATYSRQDKAAMTDMLQN